MDEKKNLKVIDDYLLGRLAEQDAKKFEKKIAGDSKLSKQVQEHKKELQAIVLYEEERLRTKMTQWKEEAIDGSSKSKQKWILVIVFLAIIFLVCFFLWNEYKSPPTPASIQANYFEKPAIPSQRSGHIFNNTPLIKQQADSLYKLGMNAYQKEDYKSAVQYLSQLTVLDSLDSTSKFYLANIFFLQSDFNNSITLFEILENDVNLPAQQRDRSLINRAIIYVQLGQLDQAKKILNNALKNPRFDFPELGKKLLEEIEMIKR